MKILSWNVNGFMSCATSGYFETIQKYKPDIICLQETKVNEQPELLMAYHQYWNFAEKKGYSGTAVFSKYTPLNVSYGINDPELDNEGRVITLEFKYFYVINVYVPNSQNGLKRFDFRNNFDIAFCEYLKKLQDLKPIIVCGDFNVPHTNLDIYPENGNVEFLTGFQTNERSNFDNLLNIGLVDVFRSLFPDKTEYSWWSPRLNKRLYNQGWRIDYFLVTKSLQEYISHFDHLTNIYGSDHCPLLLDINHRRITVNHLSDDELTKMWNSIDWEKTKNKLLLDQQQLTKATFAKHNERMIRLQNRIVNSMESKVLAVRHVAEVSNAPGIDGVKWTTPADKMRAALSLTNKDYKTQPFRHLVLKTKNKTKERRVSLPTMYDRAILTLYAYSLDPVAEANAERRSFAFRKGRSTQDVHAWICKNLSGIDAPKYVLLTDVKAYYDNISHEWLMDNIPMDKNILKEFLKSGFVFAGCLFPSESDGISLGTSLSPILGNMVLDGMQNYLYEHFYQHGEIDYPNGNLLRFADDIIVTARTETDAEKFREIIAEFLIPRGLKLSATKTKICNTYNGFDFLSRNYSNRNGVIYSTPSTKAVESFEAKMKDAIFSHKGSQQSLIEMINRKLTGFATYHRICDSLDAFVHIDNTVNALLLDFCQQKHPKMLKTKLIEKYWFKNKDGTRVYVVPNKIECQVIQLQHIILTRHKLINTFANPYLDTDYFDSLDESKEIANINGKYKSIWQRQTGKCFYCGKPILFDQNRTIVPIDITKEPTIKNLAYIHTVCQNDELSNKEIADNTDTLTGQEVLTLLTDLQKDKPTKQVYRPYELLKEYFFNLELSPHTLTFADMEKIMENSLCPSAYKFSGFWYKNSSSFADCWLGNGYIIQNLHLKEKYVVFRKENTNVSKVVIPKVFLTQKIPMNAKYEIETYLEHIRKKYGL